MKQREWLETCENNGTSGDQVFDILKDWKESDALLVEACNNYEELVTALENVTNHLADVMKNYPGVTFEDTDKIPTIKAARAVLASLKGG